MYLCGWREDVVQMAYAPLEASVDESDSVQLCSHSHSADFLMHRSQHDTYNNSSTWVNNAGAEWKHVFFISFRPDFLANDAAVTSPLPL